MNLFRSWAWPRGAAVALVFALAGCGEPPAEKPDLIVLQTGRLRGNVYPLSLETNAPLQHYPFLAGYVKAVREEAQNDGAKVLLVDLGDSLDGSFASHATDSRNMVAFFNALGYDAVALSNLDFGVAPETLAALDAGVLNPFLDATGNPATEGTAGSLEIDKEGIPVTVAANFYGDTPRDSRPDRFPARFGTTKGEVKPLRDYSFPTGADDGIQLLTWMKFESPEDPPAEFLQALRDNGVDAILAHRIYGGNQIEAWAEGGIITWDPPVSLNILRNNGGFALARLDLKRDAEGWRVLNQQLVPMTANTAPADPGIVAAIDAFAEEVKAADTAVGTLNAPMGQEEILDLYMEALAEIPGTDGVLYSPQSIRADWPKGELRASAVFNTLPWTTPVVQVTLTREQIDALQDSLGLRARLREPVPEAGPLTITTSEYFASLMAREFQLPAEAIRPTGEVSEFDFFVKILPGKLAGDTEGNAPPVTQE